MSFRQSQPGNVGKGERENLSTFYAAKLTAVYRSLTIVRDDKVEFFSNLFAQLFNCIYIAINQLQ